MSRHGQCSPYGRTVAVHNPNVPNDSELQALPDVSEMLEGVDPELPHIDDNYEDMLFHEQAEEIEFEDYQSSTKNRTQGLKDSTKSLRIVRTWGRILSFLCISGKVRFTSKQYELLAGAIKTTTLSQETLCNYKTIRSVLQWSFMKST